MHLPRATAMLMPMLVAAAAVIQAHATQANLGDLRQARGIEVLDPAGTAVLTGQFDDDDDDDDIEKEARLTGAGGARGEVDIEIDDDDQEFELEVRGLAPNQTFSIWIDGRQIGTFTTNARGSAEVEWETN